MPVRVWEDDDAIGFARIDLGRRLAAPVRLSFQRVEEEPRHLGKEGWQPEIAWIEVQDVVTSTETSIARVGPTVVSRIGEFERIAIVADGVGELGIVSWPEMARPAVDLVYGRELWLAGSASTVPAPPLPEPEPRPVTPTEPKAEIVRTPSGTRSRLPVWLGVAAAVVAGSTAAVYLSVGGDLCRIAAFPACAHAIGEAPVRTPAQPRLSESEAQAQLNGLIDGAATDAQFIEMGKKALAGGLPLIALRAFEQLDPKRNEEAAFQIARIYDPLVTDPVYASLPNRRPERASPYYNYWKRTSARSADALRQLCDAYPDFKRTNAKFAEECRN